LGYISVAHSMSLTLITLMQMYPRTTTFSKIMQTVTHYATQGHSRSPIVAPIKSLHMPSY